MADALVIGAGPAGLMAAEVMAQGGVSVRVIDQKPSVARKFLMAGKSGLNLTKDEDDATFLRAYGQSAMQLAPMLAQFGVAEVMEWAEELGQSLFVGSTGRVFPEAMKASPLLRAWLARLDELGVVRQTRMRWVGWEGEAVVLDGPESRELVTPDVVVFALGGGSWARLGSDGDWLATFTEDGHLTSDFVPSNAGLLFNWSSHMEQHFGAPLKNIRMVAGDRQSRGEAIVSSKGMEGGGLYALTPNLREHHPLTIDLTPDLDVKALQSRLKKPRGKMSGGTYLRKALKLDPVKIGLLNEFARPLPTGPELAEVIKALPIRHTGLMPLDQAISTAGGLSFDAVDRNLMLNARRGSFVAGEMLDWDAPTGGYLLTACFATGAWAGHSALRYIGR